MNTSNRLAIVALALSFAVASAQFTQTSHSEKTGFETRVLKNRRRPGVCRGLAKQRGFNAVLLFIADGKFNTSSPNPTVPNCSGTGCDAAYFWNDVIGVGEEIRKTETQKAKKFFLEEWGIPVDDYVEKKKIVFNDAYTDPRLNYRCRAMEGEKIHRFGWEVHDQVFMVIALKDLTLGGKVGGGRTIPPSAFLASGLYVVERSRIVEGRVVGMKKFVQLRYASADPVYPPIDGKSIASCRITNSPWGTGLANVNFNVDEPSNKPTKFVGRNVITLDAGDGTGRFDGVYV